MFRASLLLLPTLVPLSAQADLTALDVWTDWQATAVLHDVEISAGEIETLRNGLVLHEFRKSVTGDAGNITAVIDTITLLQQNEMVTITISSPISLRGLSENDGERILTEGTLSFGDHDYFARGSATDITYRFDFADLAFSLLSEITAPQRQEQIAAEVAFASLDGTAAFGNTEKPARLALTAGPGDVSLTGGTEGESVSVLGHTAPMSFTFELSPGEILPRQYVLETRSTGAEFSFQVPSLTGALSAGPSTNKITSGPDRLESHAVAEEIGLTLNTDVAPFPIAADIARLESRSSLPVPGLDGAQPIDFLIDLTGLALDSSIWAAFDPAGEIDRTPIDLRLDLGALGSVQEALNPLTPTEFPEILPESATLHDLTLTFGGATLAGSGAVDMQPNAITGLPEPLGSVSFTLDGGLALLEAVGRTGLVGTQQIMGAQMMLGMFTVQEPGQDRMTTEVNFEENRSIRINGVQMK